MRVVSVVLVALGMNAILNVFGIDWRLLIINLVNFGLLLLALWYFLYAPLTGMLKKRRDLVAQGVKDAERAAHHLARAEELRSQKLAEAGKEADALMAEARAAAAEREREERAKGEAAVERMRAEAEAEALELKSQALRESKEEVAKLIVLGMERLK